MQENKILNKDEIGDKIKRISYEIYEENFNEKSIVICGIENNGTIIAKKVIQELEKEHQDAIGNALVPRI